MNDLLEVAMYQLPDPVPEGTISMLEGDIEGTFPFHHQIRAGSSLRLGPHPGRQSVLFFLSGKADCVHGEVKISIKERGSLIPDPAVMLDIRAEEEVSVLEISWDLTDSDKAQMEKQKPAYPMIQLYSQCDRYTEPFKSDRTISRTIVHHNILPRFSMGSNESGENDKVELNNHPAIDQYFFSFPENDVELLIEDQKIHFAGNTFLHVPLGCYHGVEIGKGQKMHYMWIDFIVDEEAGLNYLDTIHQPVSAS